MWGRARVTLVCVLQMQGEAKIVIAQFWFVYIKRDKPSMLNTIAVLCK